MLGLLSVWLLFGICAAIVASNRGQSGCLWFGLGVLLGPIGFALAFTGGRKCPECAKRISTEAKTCPYCRTKLETPASKAAVPEKLEEKVFAVITAVVVLFGAVYWLTSRQPKDEPHYDICKKLKFGQKVVTPTGTFLIDLDDVIITKESAESEMRCEVTVTAGPHKGSKGYA